MTDLHSLMIFGKVVEADSFSEAARLAWRDSLARREIDAQRVRSLKKLIGKEAPSGVATEGAQPGKKTGQRAHHRRPVG